jgi:hypothetical protein
VFVADGYVLEKQCKFPYFGTWGPKDAGEVDGNHYLVGPYRGKNKEKWPELYRWEYCKPGKRQKGGSAEIQDEDEFEDEEGVEGDDEEEE